MAGPWEKYQGQKNGPWTKYVEPVQAEVPTTKSWTGSKEDIIFSQDEKLNNFIFASEFLQDAKRMRMMEEKNKS